MSADKNFVDIEFFNREKEKEEILNILEVKPQQINFIYGPINSGKTTLIINIIENLASLHSGISNKFEMPNNYVVFYINLRKRPISTYHDFLEVIFEVKYEGILTKVKRFLGIQGDTFNDVISDLGKMQGIPIPKGIFSRIFREEKPENAFVYILNLIKDAKSKGKTPVLIIDELQTIGDLRVNEYLIYKVFNFFIHLTKESHLCHVFALSSDSLFIERVYGEAMLQGRANFVFADDFDEETAKKFLEKYGVSKELQKLAWNSLGGKPMLLGKFISVKNKEEFIADEISFRKTELKILLKKVKELNVKITIDKEELKVEHKNLINILKKFKDSEIIDIDECDEISKTFFVNKNILFVEPKKGFLKAQSKPDLLAIREILKEI